MIAVKQSLKRLKERVSSIFSSFIKLYKFFVCLLGDEDDAAVCTKQSGCNDECGAKSKFLQSIYVAFIKFSSSHFFLFFFLIRFFNNLN